MKTFPFYKQPDQMDCGPTCLRMVAKHYGKNFSLQKLRDISGINKEGVSLFGVIGEEGKDCAFAICSYRGANGDWVSGSCGSSINGEQCRCIAQDGSTSVPFSGCLP